MGSRNGVPVQNQRAVRLNRTLSGSSPPSRRLPVADASARWGERVGGARNLLGKPARQGRRDAAGVTNHDGTRGGARLPPPPPATADRVWVTSRRRSTGPRGRRSFPLRRPRNRRLRDAHSPGRFLTDSAAGPVRGGVRTGCQVGRAVTAGRRVGRRWGGRKGRLSFRKKKAAGRV